MEIIVIHNGINILSVQEKTGEVTIHGNALVIVDVKPNALSIAEMLELEGIELIINTNINDGKDIESTI